MGEIDKLFTKFVEDEPGAIEQLRRFVGGQAGGLLDGSEPSLQILDSFLESLTKDDRWFESPLFEGLNIRSWLAVRIGYYLGYVLKKKYSTDWIQVTEEASPMLGAPAIRIAHFQLYPLEVAAEYIRGNVVGGLVGFLRDVQEEAGNKDL